MHLLVIDDSEPMRYLVRCLLRAGGIYNVTFAFIMNDAAWNKLSKTDQDLVMSVSGEYLARRTAGQARDVEFLCNGTVERQNLRCHELAPIANGFRCRLDTGAGAGGSGAR